MPQTPKKAETFLGNLMKYSVATYLGFLISGAALIVKGILPPDSYAVPASFMAYTTSLMNIGMLGLDQGLLRFYREPPEGATGRSMFAACTRLSLLVVAAVGIVGTVFGAKPLAAAFGLGAGGAVLVPFLFLNAALYMLVRYLNVLLRLENNVAAYTAETLWMQACLNLLFLLPGFFTRQTWVFIAVAVVSFGLVAIAFWFKAKAPLAAGKLPYRVIYRQMVPYSIALAPAAVLTPLFQSVALSFLAGYSGAVEQGLFSFSYQLSQLVTTVQAGFSTYWGPYVFAHYRDDQPRIGRVHDLLNFLIFGFFCCLVIIEDIIFLVFPDKAACQRFFPLMMLAAVFLILMEGTVYGNAIARRPYHDTIGVALGVVAEVLICLWLVPSYSVTGAAVALVAGNAVMFMYRTITGQYYYRTIPSIPRTVSGFLLAIAVALVGVILYQNFLLKLVAVGAILFIYCTLYRQQLQKLWQLGIGLLRKLFSRHA